MRNVIVTGGSRGLGLAMGEKLATAGYRVILIARKPSAEVESARTAVPPGSGALEFRPFDLSEVAGLGNLVRGLRAEFGPIYGLINNAGLGTGGMLANMRDQDTQRLIQLNVLSP